MIIAILATLVWFRTFGATVNADHLYALALIGDVRIDAPFRWILPPANGLFPGLLIAAFGFTVGFDGVVFHLFFTAAFSILLFIAAGYVFRRAGLNTMHIWPAAALAVILICFVGDQTLRRILFLPGSHAGVLPVALFAFGLADQSIESGMPPRRWLYTLVMFSTLSDMLTLLQIVLPIVVGAMVISWQQPQLRHLAAAMGLRTVLAALAGLALYFAVGSSRIFEHGTIGLPAPSIQAAARAAQVYAFTFPELTSRVGIVLIGGAILGVGAGVAVTARAILLRCVKKELLLLFMTVSSLTGLLSPILAGNYVEVAISRQQLPFYTMPIIILVLLLCRSLRDRMWILTPTAALIGATTIAESAASTSQRSLVLNPSFVNVANVLAQFPADLTLAEYWTAKPIYIASNRQLMVCPIVANGLPYRWIANFGWCTEGLKRWATYRNWMVIDMDARIDRNAILTTFGQPDREITLQDHQMWLFSWNHDREVNLQRIVCASMQKLKRAPPC
jgi:hypothetical protein